MADVLIERYQVCLGTGPQDPAPSIAVDAVLTFAAAQTLRDQLLTAQRAGSFDADAIAGRTYYVRSAPGQQLEAIPSVADAGGVPTRAEIEQIADQQTSVVLFARHLNPAGFVRIGTLSIAQVKTLGA